MKALVYHGARSASPTSGRSGCGGLPARSPRSKTSTSRRPAGSSTSRLLATRRRGSDPNRRALLEAVPLVQERLAKSAGEAVAAAADIGFPMVVKRAGAAAPAQELVTRPAAAIPQRMHGNPAGELSASPDVRSRLLADTPAKQDGRSKK